MIESMDGTATLAVMAAAGTGSLVGAVSGEVLGTLNTMSGLLPRKGDE